MYNNTAQMPSHLCTTASALIMHGLLLLCVLLHDPSAVSLQFQDIT